MNDLERVLSWTSADERFLDRVGANLDDDRRAILKSIVETRGDLGALARRLAPDVVERVRARMPERARKAMDLLGTPLAVAWAAPPGSPEEIARRFLETYGARLDELTSAVTKASATARAAADGMHAISTSRAVLDAAASLQQQIDELGAATKACAHPEGGEGDWVERGKSLAREGHSALESARALRRTAEELRARCTAVAADLRAWADAPPADRAGTAASMATRVHAAVTVVADMRHQIAGLAL